MNPHPTKSKPVKIGRKHTGSPSIKVKAKRAAGFVIQQKINLAKIKRYKKAVSDYHKGLTDIFPTKPRPHAHHRPNVRSARSIHALTTEQKDGARNAPAVLSGSQNVNVELR